MFANGTPAKRIRINLFLLRKKFLLPILLFFSFCDIPAQAVIELAPPQTSSIKVFFQQSSCIRFEFRQPGAVIRYALNGDEPDMNSAIYIEPICVSGSVIIKAKSFSNGFIPSETISVKCIKTSDAIKSVSGTAPREPYNKNGLLAISDKLPGGQNTRERWLGFQSDTVIWKIVFIKKQRLKKLHISLMQAQGSWIFYPVKMELLTFNGKTLGLGFFNGTSSPAEDESRIFSFPLERKLKGIIIRVQNYSAIPDWHPGKGNKPWLFADEIVVE